MTDEQLGLPGMPVRLYSAAPSRLTTYLDCPRRYRMTYLDRPTPPKGPPWAHNSVGSAVHSALAKWWDLPEEERAAGYAAHETFTAQLGERGHRVTGGAELHRSSEARTIAPHASTVTEGPWAETREQVGGFYLVEAPDLDVLLELLRILPPYDMQVSPAVDPY